MRTLLSLFITSIFSALAIAQSPPYEGPEPMGVVTLWPAEDRPQFPEAGSYGFSGLVYQNDQTGAFGYSQTSGSFVRLSVTEQPDFNDWLIIAQYNYGPVPLTWDRYWRSTIWPDPIPDRPSVNSGISREWAMNFEGFNWVTLEQSMASAGVVATIQTNAAVDFVSNGVRTRYNLDFDNFRRNVFGFPTWMGDPFGLYLIPDGSAAVVLYNAIIEEDGGKIAPGWSIQHPRWIYGSFGDDPFHRIFSFIIIPTDSGIEVPLSDIDGDGTTTIADYFDYMSKFFAGDMAADINSDGELTVEDVFLFFGAFFSEM